MRIIGWVEHLNLALSAVGNPTIYDKTIFLWAYLIESEWQTIRAELQRVLARKEDLPAFHELAADASAISNDHRWPATASVPPTTSGYVQKHGAFAKASQD
jgi:ornithine lipid ester-linked acyl 2-hydroxylase